MGDNRSYAALDWVIGEIGETLQQARQALEAFVENTEDTTRIRFCLTHIHQVHGSLQMVEFYGAALLAEEMESLAQALMNKSVRNEQEAQEVLMRAILQMPVYLDQVKRTKKDSPSSVLPLLNDLRAVRNEALLTETKLFTPNLAPAHHIADKSAAGAIDAQQFIVIVKKLRQMYQYAVAAVIKGVNVEQNVIYLNKVFSRLRKLTHGTARQPLWEISLAFIEGIESESIDRGASVKNLLRQIDLEIGSLEKGNLEELNEFTNDDLIKNLLFYIARTKHTGKHTDQIKQTYHLEDALPEAAKESSDEDEIIAPDLDAIRSVVTALKDELDAIKHALDVSLTDKDRADPGEAVPIIKRVADTMAVLGIGDLRKQILAQGQLLEKYEDGEEVPADVLMQVAGKIIEIESSLELMASGSSQAATAGTDSPSINALDQAQESVLRESRNGLEQAKDAIIEYIATQWDRAPLMNVPNSLLEIAGGLDMIPLHKPAAILTSCSQYIAEQLLEKEGEPEWQTLDTLADAIASVEYYLERLTGDRDEEDELLLGVAEESVLSLGYPIPESLRSASVSTSFHEASAASVLEKIANLEEVEIASLPSEEESVERFSDTTEQEIVVEKENVDQFLSNALDGFDEDGGLSDSALDNSQESDYSFDSTRVDVDEQVDALEAEVFDHNDSDAEKSSEGMVVSESAPESQEEEELIDEEILEIFIEEAEEVIEAIQEFFPKWADNFDDTDSLTEFRRAFHTLKGSGRMVNANDVGELAWSVENMLNRVMDNTVEPNEGHVVLIQKVIPLLQPLVDAFKNRQPHPDQVLAEQLQSWAEELSKGNRPDGLLEEGDAVVSEFDAVTDIATTAPVEPIELPAVAESSFDDDDDDAQDAMLLEIFSSEATTHLEVVQHYIKDMDDQAPIYAPPTDQMQRALHTLKGSAHMADINCIAELATPLERFFKELKNYQVNVDSDILQLLKDGVDYIQGVLVQIANNEDISIPKLSQYLARVAELKERSVAPLIRQSEAEQNQTTAVDPALLSIFMAEEIKLLLDSDQLISAWKESRQDLPTNIDPMIAELQTLEKGAELANLPSMSLLSRKLCSVYESAKNNKLTLNDDLFDALSTGHNELLDMVDVVAIGQNVKPVKESTLELFDALTESQDDVVDTIPTFGGSIPANILSNDDINFVPDDINDEPAIEINNLLDADSVSEEPSVETIDIEIPDIISEDVSEIISEVDTEDRIEETVEPVVENAAEHFSDPVEEVPTAIVEDDDDVDVEIFEIFVEEADELLEEIDEAVNEWESEWASKEPVESLKRSLHTLKGGARLAGLMGLGELAHDFETFLITQGENTEVDDQFFKVVHDYQDKLINDTQKVKARVDGHLPDGLEEVMSATAREDRAEETANQPTEVEDVKPSPVENNEAAINADSQSDDKEGSGADILPFAPVVPKPTGESDKGVSPVRPLQAPHLPASREFSTGPGQANSLTARRASPQEMVKVSAELLEELVNLAGETSISRGRLEEQNSELVFAIDEMESTVNRLQEQLRRLDIETEAQMVFRQEQMEEHEGFDPLEMDRYSQLQQLSRSLMESASDLMDLTSTLNDKTRGTETLLLQQSRINTDLQEGLMRSRMVPFSRLVPRLRRIVRQISTELGKHVSFELDNIEGELDRSVLERMVAPLEHMLRNAVDHGIESAEDRIKAGKPESGRIVLSLGREGGDVLMRLADDGRGLNLERIREKAIERGLMAADAKLSDQDVMQFILHAGFSTAESVTQISGRGVGMDVVHSEIKQLGGAMFIDSRAGQGTEFIIRLPFTVSVNRALMIQIGEDNYAIPLNTIEGIVRVSPFELEHYYQDEHARFEYAGENYRVRYLGSMLSEDILPRLEGQSLPIPVVLVRTAEHAVAIQVDKLMGSREIVVKTLGPQFSTVEGLSGATVMGDGSVVVILDPNAMIRKEMALLTSGVQQLVAAPTPEIEEEKVKTVMVVDDSVTVRKVTSRVLEREGYEVILAKDGADALLTLQDRIPDVMLLDIEMPRMDGFEVAKNIRTSSRLKHIPIIMITSRTGEKHRERALSLGVNEYMGKPYQEEKLLANIEHFVGKPTEK
ncbi:MAG: Hpt domain-containing protein [Cellvibrionaceae bacterium]